MSPLHRSCVLNKSLATGEVFNAIKELVAEHIEHLTMLTLENVVTLATPHQDSEFSNLDWVVEFLRQVGVCCVVWELPRPSVGVRK